ncbi:glycosyltransferase, partial [Arthrospira platensis SPKY2]
MESLLDQDLERDAYEIIIINDGSIDDSLDIAQNLAHQYHNVIVKTQQNQGVSAVRNLGIKVAKGDFILFIDADDTIKKNTLSKMLSFTQKNQLQISMFGMVKVKDDVVIESISDKSTERLGVVSGLILYEHRMIDSACKYF